MTLIKWRTPEQKKFEFFTNVSDEFIKKTTSVIKPYPYSLSEIRFLIEAPSIRITPILEKESREYLVAEVTQFCYYIEGGMIYTFDTQNSIARLDKENITHFKISNHEWVSVSQIHFGYGCFCVVSWEQNSFAMIGGQYAVLDLTNEAEIIEHSLKEKNMNELLENIKVRDLKIWG